MSDDYANDHKSLDNLERKLKTVVNMERKKAVRALMNDTTGSRDDESDVKIFFERAVWSSINELGDSLIGGYGWTYQETRSNGSVVQVRIFANDREPDYSAYGEPRVAPTYFLVIEVLDPETGDLDTQMTWCKSQFELRAYIAHFFDLARMFQVVFE